jgi:hypothetical protein
VARCGRGGVLASWAGAQAGTGCLLPGGRPCAGVPEQRNGQPTHDQRGDRQNGHHDRPALPKQPAQGGPAPPQPQAHRRGNHGRPWWLGAARAGPIAADLGLGNAGAARLSGTGIARLSGTSVTGLSGIGIARLSSTGSARLSSTGIARLSGTGIAGLFGMGIAGLSGGGVAGLPDAGVVTVGLVIGAQGLTGRAQRRLERQQRSLPVLFRPTRRPVIALLPHPRHPQGRGYLMVNPANNDPL